MQAYNETCASIGMDYWNHRLFLLHGDAQVHRHHGADALQRPDLRRLARRQDVLLSQSARVERPARAQPSGSASPAAPATSRASWRRCPATSTRPRATTLYVNLYAGGTADIDHAGGRLKVVQQTRYPWDGAVKMTVTPAKARQFAINVRIPGWARNEARAERPLSLHRQGRDAGDRQGQRIAGLERRPEGLRLDRPRLEGRRRHRSHPADAGPPRRRAREGRSRPGPRRAAARPDRLRRRVGRQSERQGPQHRPAGRQPADHGVPRGSAQRRAGDQGQVVRPGSTTEAGAITKAEQAFMAIPYATWANRGRGQMAVWLARTESAARPTPFPTVATSSTVVASPPPQGRGKNVRPIIDGEEPRNSAEAGSYFDWWPRAGLERGVRQQPAAGRRQGQRRQCSKGEWIEMTFAKPSAVSQTEIYWFDERRQRRRARAGVVEAALQGRRRVEAGRDHRRVRRSRRTPGTRSRSSR